jgi:ribosomal protein S27E
MQLSVKAWGTTMVRCPRCGKPPVSGLKAVFSLGFKTADCQNCGAHLTANGVILAANYLAALVGVTVGAGGSMLVDVCEWPVGRAVLTGVSVFALYCLVAHVVQTFFGAYHTSEPGP